MLTLIGAFSFSSTFTLTLAPLQFSRKVSSTTTRTLQNLHPPLATSFVFARLNASRTRLKLAFGSFSVSLRYMEFAWPRGSRLLHVGHFFLCVWPAEEDEDVRRTGRRSDFGNGIDQSEAASSNASNAKHAGGCKTSDRTRLKLCRVEVGHQETSPLPHFPFCQGSRPTLA